jgi:hypothetical protein
MTDEGRGKMDDGRGKMGERMKDETRWIICEGERMADEGRWMMDEKWMEVGDQRSAVKADLRLLTSALSSLLLAKRSSFVRRSSVLSSLIHATCRGVARRAKTEAVFYPPSVFCRRPYNTQPPTHNPPPHTPNTQQTTPTSQHTIMKNISHLPMEKVPQHHRFHRHII